MLRRLCMMVFAVVALAGCQTTNPYHDITFSAPSKDFPSPYDGYVGIWEGYVENYYRIAFVITEVNGSEAKGYYLHATGKAPKTLLYNYRYPLGNNGHTTFVGTTLYLNPGRTSKLVFFSNERGEAVYDDSNMGYWSGKTFEIRKVADWAEGNRIGAE